MHVLNFSLLYLSNWLVVVCILVHIALQVSCSIGLSLNQVNGQARRRRSVGACAQSSPTAWSPGKCAEKKRSEQRNHSDERDDPESGQTAAAETAGFSEDMLRAITSVVRCLLNEELSTSHHPREESWGDDSRRTAHYYIMKWCTYVEFAWEYRLLLIIYSLFISPPERRLLHLLILGM